MTRPLSLREHFVVLRHVWHYGIRDRELVPDSAIALRLRAASLRRHARRWGGWRDDEDVSANALELAAEYEARADVLDPPPEHRSRFPFPSHPQTHRLTQ